MNYILDAVHSVQKDSILVGKYVLNGGQTEDSQKTRVGLAAQRLLGDLVMSIGAVITVLSAVSFVVNPFGAIVGVASGLALTSLGYDIYRISKNKSEIDHSVGGFVSGVFNSVVDNVSNGSVDGPLMHPYTKGTVYRPLWDRLLAKFPRFFEV